MRRDEDRYSAVIDIASAVLMAALLIGLVVAARLTAPLRALAWTLDIVPRHQTTIVLDRDDRPAYTFWEENRTNVALEDTSRWMIAAVLAGEDRRFYDHSGLDPLAIVRAQCANVRARRVVQGGDTITQQLARTLLADRERTYRRKIREAIVAIELERRFDKNDILEAYLNTIYFGGSYYGVSAASRGYFDKSPRDLDAAESATLAALIPAPAALSNERAAHALRTRRDHVLSQMLKTGSLTPDAHERLRRSGITARLNTSESDAASSENAESEGGYFKAVVRQQLAALVGRNRVRLGGLRVYTTLDRAAQQAAEQAIATQAVDVDRRGKRTSAGEEPVQAALVALDPRTGEVRALVGGRDAVQSPFDRARQARRQPGSAFKPFIAAAALEQGLFPGSMLKDLSEPIFTIEGAWLPAGDHEADQMTVREALVQSSNRAAVHLLQQVGISSAVSVAHRLGIESEMPEVPSLALGTGEVSLLELTSAYAPFANGGLRVSPIFVRRVEDANGHVLYRAHIERRRVLQPGTAQLMTNMLADVVSHGTATNVRRRGFRSAVAGKTGTTDEFADAWFVGYTPELLAGVWIGHDMPQQILPRGFASTVAVPMWTAFMKAVGTTSAKFPPLQGYERVPICRHSGERATEYCVLPREVPGLPEGLSMVQTSATPGPEMSARRQEDESPVIYDWFPKGQAPPPCTLHNAAPADSTWLSDWPRP